MTTTDRPATDKPVRVALSEARHVATAYADALIRAGVPLPIPPPPWLHH